MIFLAHRQRPAARRGAGDFVGCGQSGRMRTVELNTAYHWNCDDCGADNFSVAVHVEFAPGEHELAYRRLNDLDEWAELPDHWEQFELVTIPATVKCSECGAEFATVEDVEV